MTQTLSNMKQLHLATQQMALDGSTTGDTNIGWPGDTGVTFATWAAQLVTNGYLTTNDLCKLLSAPKKVVSPKKFPPKMEDTALLVYAARSDYHPRTNDVFLSSANFTNSPAGGTYNAKLRLWKKQYNGFVIFRIGGDGAILQPRQVGQSNIIGGYSPLLE